MTFLQPLILLAVLLSQWSWVVESFVAPTHHCQTGIARVLPSPSSSPSLSLSSSSSSPSPSSLVRLMAAASPRRSGGGTGGKKTKTRGIAKNNRRKQKGAATTWTTTASASTEPNQQQKLKQKQHTAPPWQVVSSKDLAHNAQTEKERRRLAQTTGQHLTPSQMMDRQALLGRSTAFMDPIDRTLLAWKPFAISGGNNHHHDVEFQGAYLQKQLPPRLGVPEVAFLGRSNVGKSSLLNRLVAGDVARVGKTPGATASVNLYGIFAGAVGSGSGNNNNNKKPLMGLVDLPGFGYAKLAKETQRSVQETAEHYLEKRQELALGILLVDIRRTPTVDDKAVLAALFDMGVPLVVVATKMDKLSTQSQVDQALQTINVELGLPEGQPLCISSVTGRGIKDLWRIIMEACEGRVEELRLKVEHGRDPEDNADLSFEDIKAATAARAEDDDNEIAYSQGYDWIHGSVMYEGDNSDVMYDNDEEKDEPNEDSEFEMYENDSEPFDTFAIDQKQSMKFLRKKAKDMERRGEI